ncbi:hypothetical protein AVEN_133928-1 [Araneus ventricosus]|uniref:Uncharacterized protein n=1 Tax=Araneus ventricosus TaxID=182803 RepID=A0A4Y2D4H0_ARAVE|nr:hypothetical protein AVEN_133928-1 [Araneus ventricosus]
MNAAGEVILPRHNLLACLFTSFDVCGVVVNRQTHLVRRQNGTYDPLRSFDDQCVAQISNLLLVGSTTDGFTRFQKPMIYHILQILSNVQNSLLSIAVTLTTVTI